jgi:senataxin
MLNEQYRMHPKISHFPRHIFYGGNLLDGPNVVKSDYGNPLRSMLQMRVPQFQPLTILDLDSREERGGTSLSNSTEAELALHLYNSLNAVTEGLSSRSRVAIITPYSQQSGLLKRTFTNALGNDFNRFVEINTVDAFQGREANIVIFSAVRAAGSHGVGFLSDVRRMNVALTRAKYFLFIIARCESITVNPYWRDLVVHAHESNAVVRVPILGRTGKPQFGDPITWSLEGKHGMTKAPPPPPSVAREVAAAPKARTPADPRRKGVAPPIDPRKRKLSQR